MKLNPDCVRDVMLELEENLQIEKQNNRIYRFQALAVCDLAASMEKKLGYRSEDVVYSALQLWGGGYIATNGSLPVCGDFNVVEMGEIVYITPKGHEFIATIHSEKTWKGKIAPVLEKIGCVSLSIIESVSKGVANSVIEKIIAPTIQGA